MIRFDVWTKRRKTVTTKMLIEKANLAMKDIDSNLTLHPIIKGTAMIGCLTGLNSAVNHIRQRPLIEIRTKSRVFQYRQPFRFYSSRVYSVSINNDKPCEVKIER